MSFFPRVSPLVSGTDAVRTDVWFFPPGIPHYLQGLENGTEFLLIFDDGGFSEDETFLVSEMFARTPTEVWSKELDLPPSAFTDLPPGELFIFNGTIPSGTAAESAVVGSAGTTSQFSFHWSQQVPKTTPGGTVKILDSQTFPLAENFAAALVTVKPGAIREVHWHPGSDEWNYFISGKARMGVYVAPGSARTFDFLAGDVGYVPKSCSHYIENTGTEDVVFLEVLKQKVCCGSPGKEDCTDIECVGVYGCERRTVVGTHPAAGSERYTASER